MARSSPQSALRYPLAGFMGAEANVRILRELTGARRGAFGAFAGHAHRPGTVERPRGPHGPRTHEDCRAHRVGTGAPLKHPLAPSIEALFRAKGKQFDAIQDAVRSAAGRCGPGVVAAWLYGSVARGQDHMKSDLDIAVVAEAEVLPQVEDAMRDGLRDAEKRLAFTASVVAVDTDDILRHGLENGPWWTGLVQDGLALVGDAPDTLLAWLRRVRQARKRKAL